MIYLKKIEFLLKENESWNTQKTLPKEAVLYITDIGPLACELAAKGYAVLGFLHDGNTGESFGNCRYLCEDLQTLELGYLDRVYRRYHKLPWDILETERCSIRETTVADVDAFYQIYASDCITRYMEPLFDDPQKERTYMENYIEKVYALYELGIWTIVNKENGEIIGRAGLTFREGYEEPELGFLIARNYQGKGLATEVCRGILDYGRETFGFTRFLAFIHPENAASIRVCQKLGKEVEMIFMGS